MSKKNSQAGLRMTCLYLLPPLRLGYCGPDNKEKRKEVIDLLDNYLKNPERAMEEKIKKIIGQFNFFKYYNKIALANRVRDCFSLEVVMAYWLGNDLLYPFFAPYQWAKNIPFHLHLVLTAEVLKTGGAFDASARDLCRISWGLVKELKGEKIAAECQPLKPKGKSWELGPIVSREASWDKDIFPELKEGEIAATHWGTVVGVLNSQEKEDAIKYAQKVFELF
jgi:hypothetical protein